MLKGKNEEGGRRRMSDKVHRWGDVFASMMQWSERKDQGVCECKRERERSKEENRRMMISWVMTSVIQPFRRSQSPISCLVLQTCSCCWGRNERWERNKAGWCVCDVYVSKGWWISIHPSYIQYFPISFSSLFFASYDLIPLYIFLSLFQPSLFFLFILKVLGGFLESRITLLEFCLESSFWPRLWRIPSSYIIKWKKSSNKMLLNIQRYQTTVALHFIGIKWIS